MTPALVKLFAGVAPPIPVPHEVVALCEAATYPQRVLRLRYPGVPLFDDVCTLRGADLPDFDGLIGGFPCQDLSGANPDGKGLDGERSGLWFEMLRIVRETMPAFVVIENVARLQRMGLDVVAAGLEGLGYVVEATRIAASDVGAPHIRMRLIIVAHRDLTGTPWPTDEHGGTWARITGGHGRQMVPRWMPDGEQVGLWPTVTVKGNHNRKGLTATSGDGLATAVGMWPTVRASDGSRGAGSPERTRNDRANNTPDCLPTAVARHWPTPRASDDRRPGTSRERQGQSGHSLSVEVRNWPTVSATDYKGASREGQRRGLLPEAIGRVEGVFGPLNPAWTESLMGWPMGWTDLDCEAPELAPGFPMGQGPDQYPWEPPRMVEPRSVPNRGKRIKCCGNGWVPGVIAIGIRRAISLMR